MDCSMKSVGLRSRCLRIWDRFRNDLSSVGSESGVMG